MNSQPQAATYDAGFFADQVDGSNRSAAVMVPWILALRPGATSVVDVGCGTGTWLAEYVRNGIEDYLGVDAFLPEGELLRIPAEFALRRDLTAPLDLGRRFDIAQSLEVAEHLPACAAGIFMDTLVSLSDLVVFGAAIPGQGGTHHVNEQWQSYWWVRFEERGYVGIDALRDRAWYDSRVMWWYAQNTMVFVNRDRPDLVEAVRRAVSGEPHLDIVHPLCFRQFRDALERAQSTAADSYPVPERGAASAPLASEDYRLLMDALPRRFRNPSWARKLANEPRPWTSVALRYPFKVAYWWDLYRVQRRRRRKARRA